MCEQCLQSPGNKKKEELRDQKDKFLAYGKLEGQIRSGAGMKSKARSLRASVALLEIRVLH